MGVFAVYIIKPDGTEEINYIHTDHLGSWNTITDENGNLLQEQSFDAWGNRRDPQTWRAFTATVPEPLFDRGFTGHEHLDAVNLIHMNGRVFEPVAGRFLSRDPFIDGVASSQGMNGYAYVHNSPLSFVDPSGFNCEPLPGMSDEEAGAYVTRCTAEYDSAGWGSLRENERWCASMDFNCQQANWTQYQASVYEAAIHYYGRD